jgi:hypothetical protein
MSAFVAAFVAAAFNISEFCGSICATFVVAAAFLGRFLVKELEISGFAARAKRVFQIPCQDA